MNERKAEKGKGHTLLKKVIQQRVRHKMSCNKF